MSHGLHALFVLGAFGPGTFELPPSATPAQGVLKALFPIAAYLALAPALYLVFGRTWRELDLIAHEHQKKTLAAGGYDLRPLALFLITALILTLQFYYGEREFYEINLRPFLRDAEIRAIVDPRSLGRFVNTTKYNELYSYAWWISNRVVGYTVFPLLCWKLLFRKDSLLDMGLRVKGFRSHAWIYGLCLVIVLPVVFFASRAPDFTNYYPFYKHASRSWFDLACWEAMYCAQFFALELFFRGFWLSGLRNTLGSGAIFAMCVPYCMIHYGKPYLEAAGAVIAGVALGSLAMRTRSIYSGFLVHVTVALSMDLLTLANHHALPRALWG